MLKVEGAYNKVAHVACMKIGPRSLFVETTPFGVHDALSIESLG